MSEIVNRIPELLQQYRDEKGLGQAELAELLEVSESFMSRAIRGQMTDSIKFTFLKKVCNLLEITPNDILWQEEDPETP